MKQHVRDLYELVRAKSWVQQQHRHCDEWQAVLRRVRHQIPLRVVSCCRLAGQMLSSCQVRARHTAGI